MTRIGSSGVAGKNCEKSESLFLLDIAHSSYLKLRVSCAIIALQSRLFVRSSWLELWGGVHGGCFWRCFWRVLLAGAFCQSL